MRNNISIYDILKYCNFLIFFAMIGVYYSNGNNLYVDQYTIVLNFVQIVITHFVILDAKRNSNSLLLVLAYVIIFHFQLRIVSLNYTEYSLIFSSLLSNVTPSKINYVLSFVILMYFFLFIGIRYTYSYKKQDIINQDNKLSSNASRNILFFVYGALALDLLRLFDVPVISQIVAVISTFFFNFLFMLLLTVCYFIKYWKKVTKKYKRLFVFLILLYVLIYTGMGIRSTIYAVILMLFFCICASNYVEVRAKYILILSCVVPIMVIGFLFATLTRQMDMQKSSFTEKVDIVSKLSEQFDDSNIKLLLSPIFNRIGYFDFAVQLILDKNHLENFLSPVNYSKSVVDNLLTPGFNIYDMPRMSLVLDKCYLYNGTPNIKKYHLDEDYLSSGMSLFGEAYLFLDKHGCILFTFFIGLLFKNFYKKSLKTDEIHNLWQRAILLSLFYSVLNSYGLDWTIIDVVSYYINYRIFKKLVYNKIKSQTVKIRCLN